MKKKVLLLGVPLVILAISVALFFVFKNVVKAPADTAKTTSVTTKDTTKSVKDIVYPINLSIDQAGAIDVVVNKKHKLPDSYVPSLVSVAGGNVRPEVAENLQNLISDASSEGISLKIISSYRSYATQVSTYNGWVGQYGQTLADTFSARAGFSEHQTGLSVDLGNSDGNCALEICFGSTVAGKWLAANAVNYGFIIRYPEGKEADTGYSYEPWHIRFLGVDLAKKVVSSGKTLDQYFNVPAGHY